MKRQMFLALALLAAPLSAQTVEDRLVKARADANTAENLLRTADETWCQRADLTECRARVHRAYLDMRKVVYSLDQALETVRIAPEPEPDPDPHTGHEPPPVALPDEPAPVVDPLTGTVQMRTVADGLTVADHLTAVSIAKSGAPDVVGAFRFLCPPSHISWDDPILLPGQFGKNPHLHIYFGNTGTDASSTYDSLRETGESTCRNALNRSAYWQPAMVGQMADGSEKVIVEEYTNFYYKRRPAGDPRIEGTPVSIPRGLKFIFGGPDHPARFKCISADGNSNVSDWQNTLRAALALCSPGQHIDMIQSTPNCWDGKSLDPPDHRSHMAYPVRDRNTGREACPGTHPFLMVKLTFQRIFKIRPDDVTSTWRLSGETNEMEPGSMAHADYMMAWNDVTLGRLMASCINKMLNCSAGDLGDGGKMKVNVLYTARMAQEAVRLPIPARGERVDSVAP